MAIKKISPLFLVLTLLAACTMEPKYIRPVTDVPFEDIANTKPKISLIPWQQYFQSEDLKRVIALALDNNRDLKIANLNIESAQATHNIARANLLPSINATASETRQGVPSAFSGFTPKRQFRANLSLASYELDFFGRLRSLKKSALEDFLATNEARNIIKITIIAETANAYAQLLLDREILKITEANVAVQSDRYKFTELRYKHGIDSKSTLLAAQALIENIKNSREIYIKLVAQDKNALMALVGNFDEKLLPQKANINDLKIDENLLDLTSSQLLLFRPDIQQAEHNLKSANANIGAARAAFFPSITLTGTEGYGSKDLANLLDSRTWVFTPQINIPIFSGGRNIANLELANLRKKVQIATYEKVIQNAFRETLDQLAERQSMVNQLQSFQRILEARQKSYAISEVRHSQGINSALNVLDAKLDLLIAQQNQASIKKEAIANLITLYKVLGGGSEIEPEELKK